MNTTTVEHINEVLDAAIMWLEIRQLAKTNAALQRALNNVIIVYQLIKDNDRKNTP